MAGFSKMVPILHPYDENRVTKNICVFAEDEELQEVAKEAGAHTVGGLELIENISKGRFEIVSLNWGQNLY